MMSYTVIVFVSYCHTFIAIGRLAGCDNNNNNWPTASSYVRSSIKVYFLF